MESTVLTISNICKNYGKVKAVDGLNLTVGKGDVFGILGPNGSGKSTTLGMVLGVVNPTSGSFLWFNNDHDHKVRRRIGAILETPCFYHYLTASQNLHVVARIKQVDSNRIDAVLHRVGLLERKNDAFKTFSLGMKQRLAIASSLLADPEVMILDEPTNGLDPQGIADIRELIISLAGEGRTIILASHLLDEVQKICTDFAVLKKGKKIYQGKVHDLSGDGAHVEIASLNVDKLTTFLAQSPLITKFNDRGMAISVTLAEGTSITRFHEEIIRAGIVLSHLNMSKNTLEKKFLEILKSGEDA